MGRGWTAVLRRLHRRHESPSRALSRSNVTPKLPVSVLVVVHTAQGEVLLLERASRPGFWQSVTGSLDRPDEPLEQAAPREPREETRIPAQPPAPPRRPGAHPLHIFAQWRPRLSPG